MAETFSLDDIDKIIETEDPSFKNELADIKKQQVVGTDSIENLKLEPEDEIVKDDDEQLTARKKIVHFVLLPWLSVRTFVRLRWIRVKNNSRMLFDASVRFFRHELPERIKYTWARLKILKAWLVSEWRKFRALNRTQKLAIAFMVLASFAALFFIDKTFTGHWLPRYQINLPHTLADGGSIMGEVKSKADVQDLFQAFPEVEYYVLLPKVIVNLQPSETSGENPMGAFEVFVGADSQDTAVEVKDREQEIRDLVQRALESFTYDEANSLVGKERIKEVLRDRINAILNQGFIYNIYFNNIILYSGN